MIINGRRLTPVRRNVLTDLVRERAISVPYQALQLRDVKALQEMGLVSWRFVRRDEHPDNPLHGYVLEPTDKGRELLA